ncbi:MAG: hypothetical protein M3N19_11735 [Candidatus Eremiobacteraeota bacterium]|nr:hypothetical protein [Candidatus Eremiobacteraeota bacterium]
MSGLDPLSAIAAQIAATQPAVADASLDLGAIAQILQAQLSVGDLLEATVLPSKGGQDLISILGQTVVANLPADVHPGDIMLLQVTGFQGNQILVQNLGIQDPANPVPVFVPQLPPQPAGSGQTGATLTTITGNPLPAASTPPPPPVSSGVAPASAEPPVAPPTAVFVAASVRPAGVPVSPPGAPATPAAAPSPASETTEANAGLPAAAAAAPPRVNLESRIAASRAASAERIVPPADQNKAAAIQTPVRNIPGAPVRGENTAVRPINLPTTPPLISRAAIASQEVQAAAPEESQSPLPPARADVPRASAVPPSSTQIATSNRAAPAVQAAALSSSAQLAAAVASKEPVRILAALHMPATPVTLAAARMITSAATQVASALQHLETVLSNAPPNDARVATLQTLTTFLSRLDPRNEQTFPAQLSSFIGNVVEGAETKISQLLQALAPRNAGGAAQSAIKAALADVALPSTGQAGAAQAQVGAAHVQNVQAPPLQAPILAEARAAERQMALTQDLKTTLLSLLANPPAGASAQLTQALGDTLTALTAMQFNTLVAAQTDPTTLGFSIPVVFYEGGQATTIRVTRDAPKNKNRLDADNFHIAFILDTVSLGTVAIDLETIGRSVKVQVKTDRASAVDRFSNSLGDLSSRLEHLRYRITSVGADMVTSPAQQADAAPVVTPGVRAGKTSNVDLQA